MGVIADLYSRAARSGFKNKPYVGRKRSAARQWQLLHRANANGERVGVMIELDLFFTVAGPCDPASRWLAGFVVHFDSHLAVLVPPEM